MAQERQSRLGGLNDFQRQHRFVFLFVALLLLLIIAPVLEKSYVSREFLAAITALILFSGIYTVLQASRGVFIIALVLAALNFVTLWWEYASWSASVALVHHLGLLTFFLFIIIIILRQVSRETSINRNVIFGAVTVYLLLAFAWGSLFAILALLEPGSFRNVVIPINSHFSPVPFWYLSFLTITTIGYNDMAPASDLAKSLAVIEAVVGQLYLVLQVSLLVGLRVSEVQARRSGKS